MNFRTTRTALNAATAAYGRFADYRNKKSRELLTKISDASEQVDFPEFDLKALNERAAAVRHQLQSAEVPKQLRSQAEELRGRLPEVDVSPLTDRAVAVRGDVESFVAERKKRARKARRAAARKQRRATLAARSKKGALFAGVFALIAGIGYAIFCLVTGAKPEKIYDEQPAKVDEYLRDDEERTVVYSTTTPSEDEVDKELQELLEQSEDAPEGEK